MSDSILVRVTLDSYDLVHPSEKQTQVYVQIPEVARASWLLDESFYAVLKNEPWPHVVDEAHNEYERRGVVSDSTSEAARKAIVDWLLLSEGADYDARYDAVQAAWEADQARQHPVARKLLAQTEELQARVAELEAGLPAMQEALLKALDRVAELEAERATVYRVVDGITTIALYTSAEQARKHCEFLARREHQGDAKQELFWRLDEDTAHLEHGPEWLMECMAPGFSRLTGFGISPVPLASLFVEAGA